MILFNKNITTEPLFIAEIGVNHEGSIDAAKKMMSLAKQAGYDAAKFQMYTPSLFLSSDDKEKIARVRKFQLSLDSYNDLREFGRSIRLPVFASAISHDTVSFLKEDGVIKIASGDIDFDLLLTQVAKSEAKIILSIGASSQEDVEHAITNIKAHINCTLQEKLILLVCTSQYPCPIEDANIGRLNTLKQFGCAVGFSNHVIDKEASLCAAALGASVFEFHFTDTKQDKVFHDHLLSFDPTESASLIGQIIKIRKALGNASIQRTEHEEKSYLSIRKGLVFARSLKVGDIISENDIAFARPATHFKANDFNQILGKQVIVEVEKGSSVRQEHINFNA